MNLLPDNVFRPQASDWSSGYWPAPFDCSALECRPRLALQGLGAHISRVPAGSRTCPVHSHAFEEEVFLILDGTLTARELPASADAYQQYELHAGDMVVYPPGTGLAHGFFNLSDRSATFMGLSDDCAGEVASYPESGKTLLRNVGKIGVFDGDVDAIARANEAARQRPVVTLAENERPAHVVSGLSERDMGGVFGQRLSASGGARKVMVNRDRVTPGAWTSPLHWHSAEQELVLVLQGSPTLHQLRGTPDPGSERRGPGGLPDFNDGVVECVELQAGDLVHFGPNLPVAHRLGNLGADDCLLIVVGLADPTDVIFFPETKRFHVAALGRSAAFTSTKYFEGELPPPR